MTSKKILKMNMPEVNLYIVTVGIASIFPVSYTHLDVYKRQKEKSLLYLIDQKRI